MTGGFQCYIRGVPINIQQTLQQYYKGGTFKEYLQQLGLNETYDTADELVVTLQSEDNDEDTDRAYLATVSGIPLGSAARGRQQSPILGSADMGSERVKSH